MKKRLLIIFCVVLIGLYIYLSLCTNVFEGSATIKYLMIAVIVLFVLYVLSLISSNETKVNVRAKDKLFKSLMQNSDTVYVMMDSKNDKVLFLSNNVEKV